MFYGRIPCKRSPRGIFLHLLKCQMEKCVQIFWSFILTSSRERKLRHDFFWEKKRRARASAWLGVHSKKIRRCYFLLYSSVCTLSTNDLRIYIFTMLAAFFFSLFWSPKNMCFLPLDSMLIYTFQIKMKQLLLNPNCVWVKYGKSSVRRVGHNCLKAKSWNYTLILRVNTVSYSKDMSA